MNRVLLGTVLATAIAASVPAAAQETVKVGLVEPLTGSVAYNGQSVVKGAMLAVKELNAAGAVLGKQVELITEDGQCKTANSVSAVAKLATQAPVVALIEIGRAPCWERGGHDVSLLLVA